MCKHTVVNIKTSNFSNGSIVTNGNWLEPLTISVSATGTKRLIIMSKEKWIGDIILDSTP